MPPLLVFGGMTLFYISEKIFDLFLR